MDLVLSEGQYELVYNAFSFVIAAILGSFLFFLLTRNRTSPRYRIAITVSTIVVAIAGYHYLRIFDSWAAAFSFIDGEFVSNGTFSEGYRYVDWLLTVPLLPVGQLVVRSSATGDAAARRASVVTTGASSRLASST